VQAWAKQNLVPNSSGKICNFAKNKKKIVKKVTEMLSMDFMERLNCKLKNKAQEVMLSLNLRRRRQKTNFYQLDIKNKKNDI
jgi:hypothetical protein